MHGKSYSNDVAISAICSKNCSQMGWTRANNVTYTRAENR